MPGDPAKCSLSISSGSGHVSLLRVGLRGYLGLSHCAGSRKPEWSICLGRDKRVEGWPRFEICGYRDCSCSNIGARSGQKSWADHRQVHQASDCLTEVWGPRPRRFLSYCGAGRSLRILRTVGEGLSFEVTSVLRDSPEDVDTSEGSQPRGCFREGLLSPLAHSQLPSKARARWRRPGCSAAQRRRLPGPGAAAGAAPGSHGRRQVWEPRASSLSL